MISDKIKPPFSNDLPNEITSALRTTLWIIHVTCTYTMTTLKVTNLSTLSEVHQMKHGSETG